MKNFAITKKLKDLLFSRVIIVGALILLQLLVLLMFIIRLSNYFALLYSFFVLLSAIVTLVLINKDMNPSYKLAWVIPIMLVPLFGGLFYLMFGNPKLSKKLSEKIKATAESLEQENQQSHEATNFLANCSGGLQRQSEYLHRKGFPACVNTETEYLSPGEKKFEEMQKVLKNAKRYIFLEYFIIEEGVMWNTILDILKEKVAQGVEVRLIYDGFGCLTTLPSNYSQMLNKIGIKCIEFNPLIPVLTMMMNNRDHRKILVVDGHTGFLGGINLADEYINVKQKHGHWKDSAIKLHGDAVFSLVTMFLFLWDSITREKTDVDFYRPKAGEIQKISNGIVQPYSDSPLDGEQIGETVYLNMINKAKRYVYICSPYLIVDNETVTALQIAAKSGIDVKIMTPHHGDKWFVHMITRAYYASLIKSGVEIYEYTPGFVHSKTFVCDDEVAVIGTINLDYRSLYLHFECGAWMANTSAVMTMKTDFLKTLEKCELMTPESHQLKNKGAAAFICAVLKLFAPLM